MPKRTDIKKILVIGSGPIVIGQAAEFDYAGTQACLALKEEGYEVVLCNSNPATIMTDTTIADKVYMEPLTLEYLAKVIRYERPDAVLPGIGGQTGLNLAMQLEKKGVLRECSTELLGTSSRSIERAEDRELFKELCKEIGEPVLQSIIAESMEDGLKGFVDAAMAYAQYTFFTPVGRSRCSRLSMPPPKRAVSSASRSVWAAARASAILNRCFTENICEWR